MVGHIEQLERPHVDEQMGCRVGRLFTLVWLLSRGTSVRRATLAEATGVSERTILRDLAMLRECGIPVENDRRRGYRLEDPMEHILEWCPNEIFGGLLMGMSIAAGTCERADVEDAYNFLLRVLRSMPEDRRTAIELSMLRFNGTRRSGRERRVAS